MTARKPSRDPHPGDQVARAGLVYSVADVDMFSVTYQVALKSSVETHVVKRSTWERLMKNASAVSPVRASVRTDEGPDVLSVRPL